MILLGANASDISHARAGRRIREAGAGVELIQTTIIRADLSIRCWSEQPHPREADRCQGPGSPAQNQAMCGRYVITRDTGISQQPTVPRCLMA
ncbi:hypothetical protein GCM10009650_24300 [Nesterenkonia jeotgali]